MRRRSYSHVDGHRLLAGLGSAASSGLRGRRRLPAQGPRFARPLDRGTAATTPDRGTSATVRRVNGVAATGLGTAATALSSLALWIGGRRRRPGNRRHRMSRSGSRGHRSHRPRVHRRARYRATAVANESRWGVKN
jgi:hypothetical protein